MSKLLEKENSSNCCSFSLELYDSLRISHVEGAGRTVPLRRDISAPFAFVLKDVQRNYLDAFTQPGSPESETGLFMLEPYQPGKIAVVFVHGLLSDPLTWANIANELRARPDLMARYQMWGFEYATGEPFLKSAAVLREHLQQVQIGVADSRGVTRGPSSNAHSRQAASHSVTFRPSILSDRYSLTHF